MTKATEKNIQKILNPVGDTVRRVLPSQKQFNLYTSTDEAIERVPDYRNLERHELTNYLYELEKLDNPNADYFKFYQEFDPQGPFASQTNFVNILSKYMPSLQGMDDFKIAETAYSMINSPINVEGEDGSIRQVQRNSDLTYDQFLKQFLKKTPAENVPYSPTEFLDDPIDLNPQYTTKEVADRYKIATDDYEGKTEANFAASLGTMTEDKLAGAKAVLDKRFNTDVRVYRGDKTGELEFINPESGRPQLVNPPGVGLEDITPGGNALVLIPDAIGATIGFAVGAFPPTAGIASAIGGTAQFDPQTPQGYALKTVGSGGLGFALSAINPGLAGVAGAAAGSGIGSAFGDAARIYLGNKLYGINPKNADRKIQDQDADTEYENFIDALKDNGQFDKVNAAATAAGFGMEKVFKIVKNTFATGRIDQTLLKDIKNKKLEAIESQTLLDDMNEMLEKADIESRIMFTPGEAINDLKSLRTFKKFQDNEKFGIQGSIDKFDEERFKALSNYLKLNSKFVTGKDLKLQNQDSIEKIGQSIQNVIKKRQDGRRKIAIKAMEDADTNLTNQVVSLPNGDTKQAGVEISSVIKDIFKNEKKKLTNGYAMLLEAGGKRPITLTKDGPVAKEYEKIKKYLKQSDVPIGEINDYLKNPLRDGGAKTLEDLKITITNLLKKGDEYSPVPGYPDNLIKAYRQEFNDQLGMNDPFLLSYNDLSKQYENFMDNIAKPTADIMKIEKGTIKIGDEDVFKQVFKKGTEAGDRKNVDLLKKVLEKKPEGLDTLRNAIEVKYKNEVVNPDTNMIDLKKHKAFIDPEKGYGYALEQFLGPRAYSQLKAGADMTKVNALRKEKAERILVNLSKTTKGKLESAKPSSVYKYLMSADDPSQAKRVMAIIKDEPEVIEQVQQNALNKIYQTVFNEREKITPATFRSLRKFLSDGEGGSGETLKAIFNDAKGKQYLKNLKKVEQAVERMTRSQDVAGTGMTPEALPQFAVDLARGMLFRPLSREGKVFTGFLKYANLEMNETMGEILTNPDMLQKYLNASNMPVRSKAFRNVMGVTLGVPFKVDYEVDPDKFERQEIEQKFPIPKDQIQPISQNVSPTVDMFAMEQMPRPTAPAPVTPPPVQQPQPAGIAALPTDRGQTYAGLFPNDPSGQMIAQRGRQNA